MKFPCSDAEHKKKTHQNAKDHYKRTPPSYVASYLYASRKGGKMGKIGNDLINCQQIFRFKKKE